MSSLLPCLSSEALLWILVGGLFYTFGVPFYVLGEKVRYIYHTVWHCFVLAASISHFIALYFYIIPMKLPEKPVELF
jgi:hemolysin III